MGREVQEASWETLWLLSLRTGFSFSKVNLKGISQSKTLPTYQTSLFLGKRMHYFGMLVEIILRKATL